ncbi:DUF2931 family protein [Roseateles sp. BYS180W]|uniref:DUF2931 family protein n=1 Tax=Roseateles rivi TaxID=3299028 RepID=A0ABW7FZW6_9BURK
MPTTTTRRRWLAILGITTLGTTPALQAAGLLDKLFKSKDPAMSIETDEFIWNISACKYSLDIELRGNSRVSTLMYGNRMMDASGKDVARFYTGFGAPWGGGSTPMGGDIGRARLPKTLELSYYDYIEGVLYQLQAPLPIERIHARFSEQTVSHTKPYGQVVQKYDNIRIGVGPQGHIMVWLASVSGNQVELATYQATPVKGFDPAEYNRKLPGGSFYLTEDRFEELFDPVNRLSKPTQERIRGGWRADPRYYFETLRLKYPWRFKLTGAVSQLVELAGRYANFEGQAIGAWEMAGYRTSAEMRAVPRSAEFWYLDKEGQRRYLGLRFYQKDRALSEPDLTLVREAFATMFGPRTLADNEAMAMEPDMATVEVNVGEDFKTVTAALVKGERRLPLAMGRIETFPVQPGAYWEGTETPAPEMLKLFREGPPPKGGR